MEHQAEIEELEYIKKGIEESLSALYKQEHDAMDGALLQTIKEFRWTFVIKPDRNTEWYFLAKVKSPEFGDYHQYYIKDDKYDAYVVYHGDKEEWHIGGYDTAAVIRFVVDQKKSG